MAEEEIDGPATAGSSAPARRWAALGAYVLLGALLLFVVRPADMGSSYNIGRSIGVALMSIAISYGIWSLIRRARGSGEKWSPWILLIALFVAAFVKAIPQIETPPADREVATRASSIATLTAEDVFVEIRGLRYEPVPPKTLEQMEEIYLADPDAAEAFLSVDGRLIFETRQQVGIVTVVFSTPEAAASEDFQAGLFDGFENSVEQQGGGPITPHQLEGAEARGGPTSQGYVLTFTRENAAITVLGGDRRTAEMIANGLLMSI